MEAEKLNTAKEMIKKALNERFNYNVPKRVQTMFDETLRIFPEMRQKNADTVFIDLSELELFNSETKRVCGFSVQRIINDLHRDYSDGTLETRVTPFEQQIWKLTESEYAKLVTNEELPIEQRNQIADAWERRPNPEKELFEAALNEETPLSDRLEMFYKYNDQTSPETLAKIEAERKARITDASVSVSAKIDEILAKTPQNEPQT